MIVEGIQKVRPGVPVKIVPFNDTQKDNPGAVKPTQPAEKTK
jgi:hypothetical protein